MEPFKFKVANDSESNFGSNLDEVSATIEKIQALHSDQGEKFKLKSYGVLSCRPETDLLYRVPSAW